MTQIKQFHIANAKLLLGRLKPPDDVEEHEALSALIAVGELIAAGKYVLMPVNLSDEMMDAAAKAYHNPNHHTVMDCLTRIYRAMLSASK